MDFFQVSDTLSSSLSSSSSRGLSLIDVAVCISDLYAEVTLMENTSAEMSPVARRQANAGKLGGRKPEEQPGIALVAPQHAQHTLSLVIALQRALVVHRAGFSWWGAWGPAHLGSLSGRL